MKGGINLNSELEMENKYSKILSSKYRMEVIKQIQSDLLKRYSNIITKELEILSNNVFDFCCLMVHHIPEDENLKYSSY